MSWLSLFLHLGLNFLPGKWSPYGPCCPPRGVTWSKEWGTEVRLPGPCDGGAGAPTSRHCAVIQAVGSGLSYRHRDAITVAFPRHWGPEACLLQSDNRAGPTCASCDQEACGWPL